MWCCYYTKVTAECFSIETQNFVDLAGSERASQSLSAGARLKEGCHINRSLLTLGTVIRKLRSFLSSSYKKSFAFCVTLYNQLHEMCLGPLSIIALFLLFSILFY